MEWGTSYALALALTIVVETGLACLLRPRQARRLVVDVPLMNLFTHPLLHIGLDAGLPLALGELLVVLAEALLYRRVTGLSGSWSLWLSLALNAITWTLGYALFSSG